MPVMRIRRPGAQKANRASTAPRPKAEAAESRPQETESGLYPVLQLKTGRESSVGYRHPWVFSGALERIPEEVKHGALVHVADRQGRIIGTGTHSAATSIAVRLFEFGKAAIDRAWFAKRIAAADARRRLLGYGPGLPTDGYRVLFGESDGVPGLIVDRYRDVLVFQISTAGMEALREDALGALVDYFQPAAVVERSDLSSRREERLEETAGVRLGSVEGPVRFLEHGVEMLADVVGGQKTGFFLDQKDLRQVVRGLVSGRTVLELFAYTGATGLVAMLGGAESVHNVDSSEVALEQCRQHGALHGLDPSRFTTERADIFQWLATHTEPEYDVVMLDPPALIKSQRDVEAGRRAYHFLNRAALRLLRDGGVLVTSSCSHYLSEEDLAFELRRASVPLGLDLSVLRVVRQSPDHPLSIYFPEAAYLKTYVCHVRRPE
jgi:23S rRNA (cytosine1962-C5)-methyltransferase